MILKRNCNTRHYYVKAGHPSILLSAAVSAVILLFFIGAVTGCSSMKKKAELNAEENYQKGLTLYEKKKFVKAIPFFQKVLENYPFSIYAIPAELKIVESYFYDEKYLEALAHLQGFEELHPTNENIPYILWMKAEASFKQFTSIDRDISPLENAKRELDELMGRFPDNKYIQEAKPLQKKIREKLSQHDFYVARFYYQDGEFDAALSRFLRVYEKYPEEGPADRALYYIGKSYFFLQDNEGAQKAFNKIVEKYPESVYLARSNTFIKDIEDGRFTLVSKYFRLKERVFRWAGYE